MTWHLNNHGDGYSDENVDVNGVMTAVNGEFSPDNVEGSDQVKGVLTWQMNHNGTAVNSEFSTEKGMLTWLMEDNGGLTTAVHGGRELTAEMKNMLTCQINNGDGYSPVNVNDGTKSMLTWQLPATEVNGDGEMKKSMLTWQMNNGGLTTDTTMVNGDTKGMLKWQMNNNGGKTTVNGPVNVNDDAEGVLTWQMKNHNGLTTVNGPVNVNDDTDVMLTWQNSEDENELSKFLEEASWSEMMTCQTTKVKIINDPYWLPLKFQTGAAYVTINGNEELCGSSFSDSDTSYMAGISCSGFVGGAWDGIVDEARGWVEGEWGECEDEMLASFLGEGVGE